MTIKQFIKVKNILLILLFQSVIMKQNSLEKNKNNKSTSQKKPQSQPKYLSPKNTSSIHNLFSGFQDSQVFPAQSKRESLEIEPMNYAQLQKNNKYIEEPKTADTTDLKQLFPYQIDEIIVEIAEAEIDYQDDEVSEGEKLIKRSRQSRVWFIIVVICSLITGIQNLYIFLGTMPFRDVMITFPTVLLRLILIPIATLKLCTNRTVLLRLIFMVDKVMLSGLLQYIGVMGFILIFLPYTPSAWFYQSLFVLYPLIWLFYLANFRVSMVYCQWSKTQVLIYKATLFIGCTCYFILGVYYLVGKLRFTRGLRPQLDDSIENLLLIYINAGFQVYLQMIARMDSVDGSVNFKMNYQLHCNPEDMQALLKGRNSINEQQPQTSSSSDSSDSQEDESDLVIDQIQSQSEIQSRRSEIYEEFPPNKREKQKEKEVKKSARQLDRYIGENKSKIIIQRVSESWDSILNMENLESRKSKRRPKKLHLNDELESFEPEISKRGREQI